MSLHRSLRIDTAGTQQRSVLKRIERMKDLMQKGLWVQDQKVVGLPKTRIVKLKARKAAKAKVDPAAAGAATPEAKQEEKAA